MNLGSVLLPVLYGAGIVLCGTAVWALFALVRTAKSTGRLVEDLDDKLLPLIAQAGVTLDALNAELERVDDIVTQLEEVSDKVTTTTRVASELVGAPAAAFAGMGGNIRRIASILFGRRL